MASALAHLHRHGVAHLDVKPDNIYLQDLPEEEMAAAAAAAGGGHSGGGGGGGGGSCPGVRYKLGDFGQATRLDLKTPAAFDEGDCRWV
jgi:serine/threonine protein kinase